MNDLNSMANFSSLEEIALAVKNCSSCGLCTTRKNTVPGMGVVHPAGDILQTDVFIVLGGIVAELEPKHVYGLVNLTITDQYVFVV